MAVFGHILRISGDFGDFGASAMNFWEFASDSPYLTFFLALFVTSIIESAIKGVWKSREAVVRVKELENQLAALSKESDLEIPPGHEQYAEANLGWWRCTNCASLNPPTSDVCTCGVADS